MSFRLLGCRYGNVVHGSGIGLWAASIAATLLRAHGPIGPSQVRPAQPLGPDPSALRPGQRAA
ncbi:hypothetical protein SSAG_00322 [Streptomyces sp. Mg1]|nr:hypothetical protein SSAG_00322 [Streptomyces sp. Mg1]